ncbi:MAG: 2-C-methyl-D-erythritol 2,4-cyclodiphosphate synthase [Puniceicoccales bacterium]|jgi:2-C-methyl-D-erythritol 2,4-cyclodiphosphate synthase|nr:2-C-methyl-D-erythritol 2,4-cyclodiphosphate synthase [Puniceicoccales bacterium]
MGMRVGIGRDLHRLVAGRCLLLGGVEVESAVGCLAHSDGDCLVHSVIDSMLGALAEPNIGQMFPDTDEKNRSRSSMEMLAVVVDRAAALGYRVHNVDVVIILERPKLNSKILEMRKKLALHMRTDLSQISIKATTNEGIGPIGNGECIECLSVCLFESLP